MTAALLDYLQRDPASTRVKPARLTWSGATAEAAMDHDLQLAVWLAYELPYRGLVGVDDAWEWHRGLLEVIEEWEDLLLDALVSVTGGTSGAGAPDSAAPTMAAGTGGPAMSQALMREATFDQFRELLVHRSVYYLKEADPPTWGSSVAGTMSPHLFRSLLTEWDLSTRYGHYLDYAPGITLLISNMVSMLGRHRRLRSALAGPFGSCCAAYADKQFAAWVLPRWAAGQSSLLQGLTN